MNRRPLIVAEERKKVTAELFRCVPNGADDFEIVHRVLASEPQINLVFDDKWKQV